MQAVVPAWKCPACQTSIRREGEVPRQGVVYRCHVCRLELIADLIAEKLVLAPIPGESTDRDGTRRRSLTRPRASNPKSRPFLRRTSQRQFTRPDARTFCRSDERADALGTVDRDHACIHIRIDTSGLEDRQRGTNESDHPQMSERVAQPTNGGGFPRQQACAVGRGPGPA
jgi:hypothetical protein